MPTHLRPRTSYCWMGVCFTLATTSPDTNQTEGCAGRDRWQWQFKLKSCNGIIPNGENDIKVDRITIINFALQILQFVPLPFTLSYEHIFTALQTFLLLNDIIVPALFMNMTLFVMSRNFIKWYIDSLLNLACSFLGNDTRVVWQVSAHVSKERTASIFTGSQGTTMYTLMLCTFCALSSSV